MNSKTSRRNFLKSTSLIGSAISYMLRGPISLSSIQPSISIESTTNEMEMTMVTNATSDEAADDTNIANIKIEPGAIEMIPILTANIWSD